MKVDTARFVSRVRHRVIEHMYFARARHVPHDRFFETKVIETSDATYQTVRTPRAQTVRVAQPLPTLASWTDALFARARHGGLHVVLVPTVGPLRASARDGVEKRVALELIGVDRVDRAIEGDIDVFCDRRRTRRLRLYARVLFFDPSTREFGAAIPCEQGQTRREKQQRADFSRALRSCEDGAVRSEAKRETNDEYCGKRSEVSDYARDENDTL
jgi:hypothetical protein